MIVEWMGRTVTVGVMGSDVQVVDRTGVVQITWHHARKRRRAFNGYILSF